jgi:chromosome segregation ATPase
MSTISSTSAIMVGSQVVNGNDTAVGSSEPLRALQSLIQAVKTLALQSHFTLLDNHFKEFSGLEQELIVKEDSLKAHQNVNQTLATEKGRVETEAKERETFITQLQGERDSLQLQVRQLEESSSAQKEAITEAGKKVEELVKNLEDQNDRIQHLEKCLETESGEVERLKSEKESVQATNASLLQILEESNRQLGEFGKFTVPLVEEDIAVS